MYWRVCFGGVFNYAHRYAWEHEVGKIPIGMELHHTCENPECINVEHLILLTKADHTRLHSPTHKYRSKLTHCKRGHALVPGNFNGATRRCKACHNMLQQKRRAQT